VSGDPRRLRIAYVVALAAAVALLWAPWAQQRVPAMGKTDPVTFAERGWGLVALSGIALLLLGFSWRELGPVGSRIRRDVSWVVALAFAAAPVALKRGLFHAWPTVTGEGVTVWLWLGLGAAVAAAVLATLLVPRGDGPRVVGVVREPLRGVWPLALPLVAAPLVEVTPVFAEWPVSSLYSAEIYAAAVLAVWACAVRAGAVRREVGLRVLGELGRLVGLLAGVALLLAVLLRRSLFHSDVNGPWGILCEVAPGLVASVVATAFARGGYGSLRRLRLPEVLRVDRIAPPEDA
jgi:hypothetical protein